MEFADVVRRRRMVRDYDPDRPVPPEVRERLLEHALRAPSAGFTQGWAFLVLEDAADRELFWSATTSESAPDGWLTRMRRAPLLVVPLSSKAAYLERYAEPDKEPFALQDEDNWPVKFWDIDAAMASMVALLAAVDRGLGGWFWGMSAGEREMLEHFGVPGGIRPVGVMGFGYRSAHVQPTGSGATRTRRPLDEQIHRNGW